MESLYSDVYLKVQQSICTEGRKDLYSSVILIPAPGVSEARLLVEVQGK